MLSLGRSHTRGINGAREKRGAAGEFVRCNWRGLSQSDCRRTEIPGAGGSSALEAAGIIWVFPKLCNRAEAEELLSAQSSGLKCSRQMQGLS